jgi:hypothetical protein
MEGGEHRYPRIPETVRQKKTQCYFQGTKSYIIFILTYLPIL